MLRSYSKELVRDWDGVFKSTKGLMDGLSCVMGAGVLLMGCDKW